MHYLFLGDDSVSKEQRILAFRKKFFPSLDAVRFDCDTFSASKVSAEELKKSLLALPAMGPSRLVIVREIEKLKAEQQRILKEFFESGEGHTTVVLEGDCGLKDKFVQAIRSFVTVEEALAAKETVNVFDVTRLMASFRQAEMMTALHQVLDTGAHPLQIMGGLTWFWGNKARSRVSRQRFEKGLLFLQEADLNIKRSKLPPDYALELLVTKLCVLLNG